MEIPHGKVAEQHNLGLDRGIRDGLADYCRHRWPTSTAKQVAREWNLTLDEAKGVVACRTSLATIERILKNGGWDVAMPLLAAVIGTQLDTHLENGNRRHEEHLERRRALVADLRTPRRASPFSGPGVGSGGRGGDRAEDRRASQGQG